MNKDTIEKRRQKSRARVSNDRLDVIAAKRDQLEGEIQQAFTRIKTTTEDQDSFRAFGRGLQRISIPPMLH
ncbi:CsbD family protein [Marinobacter halophilus]|uniref:CsbD family protein n=1 Tax=Marinobacter halophilus TaxID=1323740 RepID=A0A2T1KH36_9GAMM|nr:CsbD family protein [Marinobacter halophilus]PSF09360.1 CsbD family protein [Marinobacter halophilus]GGC78536.1 hypothetical protein GCM10011362_28870 [Marinobacter halophilus]